MSGTELAREVFVWGIVLGFSSTMLLLVALLAATIYKEVFK